MITPVLLCGGSGTRLWPLSRKSYPKQFADVIAGGSLFQGSASRLIGEGFASPMVVTGSDFRFVVTEQMTEIGVSPSAILIEPSARNTAPAVLAAALELHARDASSLMLVMPSDHVIPDTQRFRDAVLAGVPAAEAGRLVTFGIRPDRAETGYGWLELSEQPERDFAPVPQSLKAFVEKPDAVAAQAMLDGGRHLWNAGIFLFATDALIQAFVTHAPDLLEGVQAALAGAEADLGFTRLAAEPWAALRDVSIDYAVMEKAGNLTVVPYAGTWSDLGGWEAVWRDSGPDESGVVTHGPATAINCENSLLRSEGTNLQLVGIGLKGIVAVATPDAVLIADKSCAQDVKIAVERLKGQGVPQAEAFPHEHRPWGRFESLATGNRFQVKRITVRPGASLSLQSHHHRAEHWIVVEGTARVSINDVDQLVSENQSVYIPVGAKHRLENPGKLPVVLIEVQTGSYLGEDDIVRYQDQYARS